LRQNEEYIQNNINVKRFKMNGDFSAPIYYTKATILQGSPNPRHSNLAHLQSCPQKWSF
jgi:hypothetical protein